MMYLSRNKIYEKLPIQKDAKKIYIFCEGQDKEVKYFQYFQGFSSNIDIIPIPNNNGQSSPFRLKENADLLFFGGETAPPQYELSVDYKDEVWFVIDTDRWNEGNKIQQLKEYCKSKNTMGNQWFVVQSNPCFELWLYYHFYTEKPSEENIKKSSSFKAFLNSQIIGGFDNRSMPIELLSAIANSLKNFETENEQPKLYSTEVHNLGQVIIPFVKEQLNKAKEMISKQKA